MPLNMLQITKRSRRKPQPGDIFVFQMRQDRLFRYGRVIRTDTNLGLDEANTILVYIYKAASPQKLPVPHLSSGELLLPPLGLNETGWREGYFETVEHRPLAEDDVLLVHCFHDPPSLRHPFVDADGKPLPRRYEPCGLYAIGGYGSVDLKVSDVLGFPDPTEDPSDFASKPAVGGGGTKSEKQKRKRRDVEHAVILYVAEPPSGPLADGFNEFEDRLIEAVERAGVGRWDGHEFGLEAGSEARVYFYGKDADRLAGVLLPIAREAGLGGGSFLQKRYGEPGDAEERVDL